MQKKFILVALMLMSLIGGIGGLQANDTITSVLPVLKKDQRGYKLPPVVVYNKATGNYESVRLRVDANGNLYTVGGGTNSVTIVGTVAVTQSGSWVINGGTITTITNTITISDERYEGKTSTGTAGKVNATGTISPPFEVIDWSFLSQGGETTMTTDVSGGTTYLLEDIAVNGKYTNPLSTPTFSFTLPVNTTVYYIINGIK